MIFNQRYTATLSGLYAPFNWLISCYREEYHPEIKNENKISNTSSNCMEEIYNNIYFIQKGKTSNEYIC